MTPLAPIAIYGWIPVCLLLFSLMPARRAVIVGMLGAWLFLPMVSFKFPGLPDVTKTSVACVSLLIGTLAFDTPRYAQLRWSAVDIPILAWILVPLPSAIAGGHGVYEGLTTSLNVAIAWGIPYLLGRLYFQSVEGLRELALGIFVGGLVYTPFVLFEARMSPQLHTWVYGFHQHDFGQSRRGDGWRPVVFMQHGLAVAMFMGTAALCGLWLAWAKGLSRFLGLPTILFAGGLMAVTIACRSSYAAILMLIGAAILVASRLLNVKVLALMLLLVPPAYVAARTVGGWNASGLVQISESLSDDRAASLRVRLQSEDVMWRWVQRGDVFFGRGRIEVGQINEGEWLIPDGLWIIALGRNGILGLSALLALLLLPTWFFLWRNGPQVFRRPDAAGAAALGMALTLYALDGLMNAMLNPVYMIAAGGLAACRLPPITLARPTPRPALVQRAAPPTPPSPSERSARQAPSPP